MNRTLQENRAENFALFHAIREAREKINDPALQSERVSRVLQNHLVDLQILYLANEQEHTLTLQK